MLSNKQVSTRYNVILTTLSPRKNFAHCSTLESGCISKILCGVTGQEEQYRELYNYVTNLPDASAIKCVAIKWHSMLLCSPDQTNYEPMSYKINEHPGILLKKAARLFEQVANKKLDHLGVTHAQTVILIRLWEQDGQNQIELTKSSGLDQSTIVRLLDRMERDNLITRIRNENDRRVFNFYLTSVAKKVCQKLDVYSYEMTQIAHESFSKKDIEKLTQSILLIIDNLQQFLDSA